MSGLLPTSIDPALIFPILLLSLPVLYLSTRVYSYLIGASKKNTYDPTTGLGRGAPGFQTGVRKVRIPTALAARIQMGEDVSAEEITEALAEERARIEKEEAEEREREERERKGVKKMVIPEGVDEEWLPQSVMGGGKAQGRRRKK